VGDTVLCAERGGIERWAIQCCAERGEKLRVGRYSVFLIQGKNLALGDTVFCAERGEEFSGGRYSIMLREGRYQAVGDTVLCSERGEKLSGGR